MGLAKTPIFARGLDGGGAFDGLAEGLHHYTRRWRNMCVGGGRRRGLVCDCGLLRVRYHLPRSLILPVS
jgi:hypothetical protein